MPNPEQNKWIEELWKSSEDAGQKTSSAQVIGTSAAEIILQKAVSQTRQETIEQIEKTIKARLKYCQEHNGLPYCKNCGLELLDIERLK